MFVIFFFFRRRPKKQEYSLDEIPPEKLSQEAFRLLRTAKSLLNTEEPDITNQTNEIQTNCENDVEFMVKLAKEFPRIKETSQRTSISYSMCPKLIKPEECKISMAIKRNIPLQNNEDIDDNISLDNCLMSSTAINEKLVENTFKDVKIREKIIKSSPPSSNAGSTEDESGFSSMNSYQEIGIPLNGYDDSKHKEISIKKIHRKNVKNVDDVDDDDVQSIDDIKLWQKPNYPFHRRWSSTPVDVVVPTDQTIKVLWV